MYMYNSLMMYVCMEIYSPKKKIEEYQLGKKLYKIKEKHCNTK